MGLTRTVLVVEDDADTREVLTAVLTRAGYDVTAAGDGPAALDLLRGELPDLVVTDMMLPGVSGFQVLHAAKEASDGRVAVIMISGHAGLAHRQYALAAGADVFLAKPFPARSLVQAVASLCPPAPAFAPEPAAAR